jgi:hypothetical protein
MLLVLLVGSTGLGCTGGGSSSSAAATPSSTPAPTATEAPGSVSPSAVAPSVPVVPSALVVPHDDPALEASLPDAFRGATLDKLSVGPVSSAGNEGAQPIKALAREIGDGSGNFALAFAYSPADPTYNLFAWRIHGAPAEKLLDRYSQLTLADAAGSTSDKVRLGTRDVTHVTAPGAVLDSWFYAAGDTLFGVQARSAADADALLALLP